MQRKETIIDHTTTCPHCGQRCLHENLGKHIRSQHPGLAAEDNVAREMVTPGFNGCPYCKKSFAMNQLYEHITLEHPENRWYAEERAKEMDRERAKRKRERRKRRLAKLDQPAQKQGGNKP